MWNYAQAKREPARGTRCLGIFLAALVLFLAAMAVSPAAHGELHHNANHAEHQCAITMFAQGVEPAHCAVDVASSLELAATGAQIAREFAGVAEPAHLRPPASGPPVA